MLVPLLFLLLWRPGEPPVLLLGAGMQWLSVYLPVVSASLDGLPVGQLYGLETMDTAAWLGLMTVLVIALGMRTAVGQLRLYDSRHLDVLACQLDARRLLLAYLIAFGVSLVIPEVAGKFASARQLILPLGQLRWVLGFMLLWSVARGVMPWFWAVPLVFLEIVIGFGGYFGDFRQIIYLTILAFLAGSESRARLFRPTVIGVLALGLFLAIFWQAIKGEYRSYLNQGTGMQVVLVSPGARADYLVDAAMDLSVADLSSGLETMILRMSYLEYFARSIGQVPAMIPYQDGRLFIEVFQHIFMPRLFFPNKPSISDSERTNEFTGVGVAGAAQGTSIGIGYAGESYIDFGPYLMFAPIFVYGVFWGWGYRVLVRRSRYTLLSVSAAVVFLMPSVTLFEQSNLKLVGGGITSMVVLAFILTFFGSILWRFLTSRRRRVARRIEKPDRDLARDANPAYSTVPLRMHKGRL